MPPTSGYFSSFSKYPNNGLLDFSTNLSLGGLGSDYSTEFSRLTNQYATPSPNLFSQATGVAGDIGGFLAGGLSSLGGLLGAANPLTAGIGALGSVAGMLGSAFSKKPNVNTNIGSYLDKGLSDQAAKFQDFNSDYYRKGEEGLRRTLMDATPSSNSLLSLAAATGGSASQANLQRKAAETKALEGVNTGMSNLYQQGQDLGLKYTGLNWDQASKSMQGTLDNEWSKYNAKQAQWNQLSNFGTGLMGYGMGLPKR